MKVSRHCSVKFRPFLSSTVTTASSDPFNLEAFTPNHILLNNSQPVLPTGEFSKYDSYTRRRWKQVQYLANVFWRRWTQEYVTVMQKRHKWSKARTNLKVGDIVVVVDPTSPRSSLSLARIVETKPDWNGMVVQSNCKQRQVSWSDQSQSCAYY